MVKKKIRKQNSFLRAARKTAHALQYIRDIHQGNLTSIGSRAYSDAKAWLNTQLPDGMPQRRKQRVVVKKRKPRRRRNNFMGVTSIPCRRVVVYESSSGTTHRWLYNIKLSIFMKTFQDEYQDFKMTNMRIRYIPNNSTNETGLYAAVLLDSEGFGAWGSATAVQWFQTIGAMPGARIRPRYVSTTFRWRPTEPSAREWHTRSQDLTYATVYICNNGKETDELGGMLEITGTMLVRGLYYNAVVKKQIASALGSIQSQISVSPLNISSIEHDADMSHCGECSRTSSRPSSRIYGGFVTLG